VVVDDSSLQADSQPKSGGLVWGSAAAWRCSTFTRWTERTLTMTLWSWWQHYEYRRDIIIIIITFSNRSTRILQIFSGATDFSDFAKSFQLILSHSSWIPI